MFIDIDTQEYPIAESEIRQRNPMVSYGRPFRPAGYALVAIEAVDYDPNTQRLVSGGVVQVDGQYIEKQMVVSLTEEEFNARQLEEEIPLAVLRKLLVKQLDASPGEEIDDYSSLFPAFRVGEAVLAGDRRQYDGHVWQAIRPHTTQLIWLPGTVSAPWGRAYLGGDAHQKFIL